MPYVTQNIREDLEQSILEILAKLEKHDHHPGCYNYVFTKLLLGKLGEALSYKNLNEAIGILECCKLELYRRFGADLEDKAIARNGDLEEYAS